MHKRRLLQTDGRSGPIALHDRWCCPDDNGSPRCIYEAVLHRRIGGERCQSHRRYPAILHDNGRAASQKVGDALHTVSGGTFGAATDTKTARVKFGGASSQGRDGARLRRVHERQTGNTLPTGVSRELDPDELAWNYVKRTGTAKNPLAFGELLKDRIDADLQAVQADPALVKSFFRVPFVAYIADWLAIETVAYPRSDSPNAKLSNDFPLARKSLNSLRCSSDPSAILPSAQIQIVFTSNR